VEQRGAIGAESLEAIERPIVLTKADMDERGAEQSEGGITRVRIYVDLIKKPVCVGMRSVSSFRSTSR
jgi:hypothetical protein